MPKTGHTDQDLGSDYAEFDDRPSGAERVTGDDRGIGDDRPGRGGEWPDREVASSDWALQESSLADAVRSNWRIVALAVAVLMLAALAYGLLRDPVYTATADINIGRADVETTSISGFVEGATVLAASYSEALEGQELQQQIAGVSKIPAPEVAERVEATAIPDRPTFTVRASGEDNASAVALAFIVIDELQKYADETNNSDEQADEVFRRYRSNARQLTSLRSRIRRLEAQQAGAGPTEQRRIEDEIDQLNVEADVFALQVETLGELYREARGDEQGSVRLSVLNPPTSAQSDRLSVLQQVLFAALISGLILGAGLAVLVESRTRRRK